MTGLQSLFAVVSAIVLFIYGLQGFSRELRAVGGLALQSWLGRVTASRWLGFAVGALATAVVQSSSAITSLTTALVDGSVISFRASLGVLLGSNVGTTATAWLVSLKLTGIGSFFIFDGIAGECRNERCGPRNCNGQLSVQCSGRGPLLPFPAAVRTRNGGACRRSWYGCRFGASHLQSDNRASVPCFPGLDRTAGSNVTAAR